MGDDFSTVYAFVGLVSSGAVIVVMLRESVLQSMDDTYQKLTGVLLVILFTTLLWPVALGAIVYKEWKDKK